MGKKVKGLKGTSISRKKQAKSTDSSGHTPDKSRPIKPNKWACASLEDQLKAFGLRISEMTPDGNCFFRAVADQQYGDASKHRDVRAAVVKHMHANSDMFAPFVEDDEDFDSYLRNMSKDAVWAGHMEVQAASLHFASNVHIYQQGQPLWRVLNFSPPEQHPCMHLSYHDGDHYNSVRLLDDWDDGPPRPINLANCQADPACLPQAPFGEREMKQVSENTYCFDQARVERALQECSGDPDKATEWLIESLANDPVSDDEAKNAGFGTARSVACALATSAVLAMDDSAICQGPRQAQAAPESKEMQGRRAHTCEGSVASQHGQALDGPDGDRSLSQLSGAGSLADMEVSKWPGHDRCGEDILAKESQFERHTLVDGQLMGGATTARVKAGSKAGSKLKKPGKNKMCSCGSGKKYKNCCKPAHDAKARRNAGSGLHAAMDDKGSTATLAAHLQAIDI